MAFELDHLFIATAVGAPAAEHCLALGLVEGSRNVHPGQGTANRRFFFHNAMLELLWVQNPEEAQSELIRRSRLWERWNQRGGLACPFGLCLRPRAGSEGKLAFPSWDYRPPYLPEPLSIAIATNSDNLNEPMLFQTPFGQRPDLFSEAKRQPLDHPIGWREITRVTVGGPNCEARSPEFQAVLQAQPLDVRLVNVRWGTTYSLELGFDGETQGQRRDLSPHLPLVVSW